jgi:hypothetical protein
MQRVGVLNERAHDHAAALGAQGRRGRSTDQRQRDTFPAGAGSFKPGSVRPLSQSDGGVYFAAGAGCESSRLAPRSSC